MKFDLKYKLQLTKSLQEEKFKFFDELISLSNKTPELTRIGFYDFLLASNVADKAYIKSVKGNVQECLRFKQSPIFKNGLTFSFPPSEATIIDSDEEMVRFENLIENVKRVENGFWMDPVNKESYQKVGGSFLCFVDKEVLTKEMSKYSLQGCVIDIQEWVSYIKRLLNFFLPAFEINKQLSGEVVRFLNPVTKNILLGVEFNEREFKADLSKGRLCLPTFKLVIVNVELESKEIDSKGRIVVQTGLQNPFFTSPGISFDRVFNSFKEKHSLLFDVVTARDKVAIVHSKKIAERLKKYAFFSFYVDAHFLEVYIKYLVKSIERSLNGDNDTKAQLKSHLEDIKKRNEFLGKQITEMEDVLFDYSSKNNKMFFSAIKKLQAGVDMMRKEYEANRILIEDNSGNG